MHINNLLQRSVNDTWRSSSKSTPSRIGIRPMRPYAKPSDITGARIDPNRVSRRTWDSFTIMAVTSGAALKKNDWPVGRNPRPANGSVLSARLRLGHDPPFVKAGGSASKRALTNVPFFVFGGGRIPLIDGFRTWPRRRAAKNPLRKPDRESLQQDPILFQQKISKFHSTKKTLASRKKQ